MTVGTAMRLSGLGELADVLASWPEASAAGRDRLSDPCRTFVDRPRVTTRLDSIASLQYQAAAAIWAPHVSRRTQGPGGPATP